MNNAVRRARLIEARQRFGRAVRRQRNEQSLTQEQFAERIAKTVEFVSLLERGERSPSFEIILDIADALRITASDLISSDQLEIDRGLTDALPAPLTKSLPEPVLEMISAQRETDLARLEEAFRGLRQMQQLANEYGVNDVLQDNGGKVLQVLIVLGLRISPGREGNDAVDSEGNEYELKTVNRSLRKNAGITTHHHLNHGIIAKYRLVKAWYIAFYESIELKEIYRVLPEQLEALFLQWEAKITVSGPLNNPKIPVRYVQRGERVYPPA